MNSLTFSRSLLLKLLVIWISRIGHVKRDVRYIIVPCPCHFYQVREEQPCWRVHQVGKRSETASSLKVIMVLQVATFMAGAICRTELFLSVVFRFSFNRSGCDEFLILPKHMVYLICGEKLRSFWFYRPLSIWSKKALPELKVSFWWSTVGRMTSFQKRWIRKRHHCVGFFLAHLV